MKTFCFCLKAFGDTLMSHRAGSKLFHALGPQKIKLHCYVLVILYIVAWKEVVREDCQARKLNKEDAMDRCKWRKMIKEAR